jgi:hypothetical protein
MFLFISTAPVPASSPETQQKIRNTDRSLQCCVQVSLVTQFLEISSCPLPIFKKENQEKFP